jgi:hypothetical protein
VIELALVDVRGEDDVVRAHQTTRTIVAQLGFSTFEQTPPRAPSSSTPTAACRSSPTRAS